MRQQLDRYKEMDYTFGSSRECKLLDDLTNDVFEYDSISPLDPWKTTMLLRVKKTLGGAGEEEEINLT